MLTPSTTSLPTSPGRTGGRARGRAVTLDLNGRVAVRACRRSEAPATELVLSRSHDTGAPIRLSVDCTPLSGALRLGFREVASTYAESPVVCRDGRRVDAWKTPAV